MEVYKSELENLLSLLNKGYTEVNQELNNQSDFKRTSSGNDVVNINHQALFKATEGLNSVLQSIKKIKSI